jgi:hypothetical protein
MHEYGLTFTLLSDATFGRGEGIAGLIDREVEHDQYGLPYLRGRTLKGLITEEVDNVLFALEQDGIDDARWTNARLALFGRPGSTAEDRGRLRFGHAELPAAVRQAIRATSGANRLMVLESLTTVRRQTAVGSVEKRNDEERDEERRADEEREAAKHEAEKREARNYGVPVDGSLRAMRVILRQTPFEARLLSEDELSANELGLLAAAVLAFRRAGTGRNRGRGKLRADLKDASGQSLLAASYEHFVHETFGLINEEAATS